MHRLGEAEAAALQDISITKKLKKGEYLLRQGKVCRNSYTVKEGIARKYYLGDGKEITTELFFENDIAVVFDSYCTQQPGREFIQAVTDTVVSQISHDAFREVKKTFPQLAELDLLLTEYYAMWLEERLFHFHTLTAPERYHLLLKEHPHALRHIPLTIIASYLGISPETLSRIRAKF